jgi:hypothetical protein
MQMSWNGHKKFQFKLLANYLLEFLKKKSCVVGLGCHFSFGVSSLLECCLQSLAINDQTLKTQHRLPSKIHVF